MLSESTVRASHAVFARMAYEYKRQLWQIDDDIIYLIDNYPQEENLLLTLVRQRNIAWTNWTAAERIAGEFECFIVSQ